MKRTQLFTVVIALFALIVCTVLFAKDNALTKENSKNNFIDTYKIVSGYSVNELENKLKEQRHFIPAGGLVIEKFIDTNGKETTIYYQAIYTQ